MHPSATLCRSQQAYHRDRAETSPLAAIRTLAQKVATAWSVETEAAEAREARRGRTRLIADTLRWQKQRLIDEEHLHPNTNSDLGRADP